MNKIYKVIWSHVKQCYVVTSELTKSQHKSSSKSELISTNVHQKRYFGKAAVAAIVAGLLTFGSYGLADAAGPAATGNGPASKADGIGSIAVGIGDKVVSSNTYQGATSLAVGTLNIVDADDKVPFDGVASSVIGQVNYTKNANAAIIFGAGNKVTNSYQPVAGLDEATVNQIMAYYQKGQMDKVTELLQKAVPKSGGQVMVMGGGNTVDYAQASQVMGVSNTLQGTKDSISKYNLVDGFQNSVTNSQNTYVVGTNNRFVNMANSIVLGDNNNRIANNTDRTMKDTIVIGDGNTVQNGDESIAIGKNITIQRDGGNGYEYDTGNVAIGSNAYISSYVNQGDSIAIGKNASVINMNGSLEQAFAFGRPMGKEYSGSIAIGQNSYARSGSTMIGIHDYQGTIGDLEVDFTRGKSAGSSGIGNYQESIDATTIGNNSYNNGVFSTVVGSYTAVSGLYHNQKWGEKPYGVQNFGAAVLGSLNSVESLTSEDHNTAGMADSILGSANRTQNANGTVMVGAGNVVTNSINDFDASGIKVKGGIADPNTLSEAMRTAIKDQNGGGAAAVVGNGNVVDNATNVSILGSKNSLKDTAKAQLLGDNRVVESADNSVIVGSANSELTTSNKNVTVLGYNANASVDGGVAVGSESLATVDKGVAGYDPKGEDHSADTTGTWKSTAAAVSVGNKKKNLTRQITNVAAGTEDTDAVNVAQLKASEKKVAVVFDDRGSLLSTDATVNHEHEIGDKITNVSKGIALGNNATVYNQSGSKADAMKFGSNMYTSGIAIGENSYALEDSIDLGNKIYNGAMGDVTDLSKYNKTTSTGTGRVLIGNNSYSSGSLSTLIGNHSIMTTSYLNGAKGLIGRLYSAQNAGAVSIGALNSIESYSSSDLMSGVANDIIGLANKTRNSNGALILGAGNEINNSIASISVSGSSTMDVATAAQKIRDVMAKGTYAGGATLAIGGGNKADYTQNSQLMGVGNSLTGTSSSISKFNMLDGYKNTATNVSNTKILGSNNTVNDKADSNTIIGDKHVVAAEKTNNVIIGNADQELTTSASDAVLIGHNADVKVDGGVALGSGSVASTSAEVNGYDPLTGSASTSKDIAWKSTWAAASIGDSKHTRQLTNVAAGYADTDAVNVAQLKAVASKVGSVMKLVAGDGISIVNKDGVYTISANIKGGSTPTDDVKVDPEKPGEGGNTSGATTDTPVTPVDPGNTGNPGNPGNTENPSNGNGLIITAETKPTNFSADSGEATAVKPGENLAIKGDTTNITTTASDHGITVSLKKDITVDSVTAGDTKMTSDGLTITGGPSITKSGIDAGGKKVTHVADGEIAAESKDAVNGSQLYRVQKNVESIENNVINLAGDVTNLSGRVSNLDNRINKVGAGAAALAALHPLDFNPDDKWNFAVGYGNYRNANSVALGAFYQPNENTMFNVATNFGNGENMFNAGVSFKIGRGNSYAGVSKAQLVAENQQLKANDTLQDQKIQKQDQEIQELKKALEELKSRIK